MALPFDSSMSIEEKLSEQTGVIGERIEIAAYEKLEAPFVAAYIHTGNKLASLVGFSGVPSHEDAGKNVAMQVAAMDPIAVDKNDVAQEVIDRELEWVATWHARKANRRKCLTGLHKVAWVNFLRSIP